jgi:hypothetical protein
VKTDKGLSIVQAVSESIYVPGSLSRKRLGAGIAVAAVCVSLSAMTIVPFFFMGKPAQGQSRWQLRMPGTHDMYLHLDQMKSFDQGLRAGEIYPKWELDTNRGFGAPTTSFYPPGIYYLTSLGYFLFHNWLLALLWSQIAIMIASGAAMYLYARRHMSRPAAMLAMCLYVILPYHLIDLYQRGAIAELLGFVCMPLLLLFIESLFGWDGFGLTKQRNARQEGPPGSGFHSAAEGLAHNAATVSPSQRSAILSVVGLALVYAAFVWSHPPTAYQFSLVLAIAIPWFAIVTRRWKGVLLSGVGLVTGLGLAAAYIYPAAKEKGLIANEFIAQLWPYHESYVLVHDKPFFSALINQTWILNLAILVLCAAAIIGIGLRDRFYPSPRRAAVILWIAIGCIASFMMTSASYQIGRRIPMIDIGVFSWRMLSITTLAAALLAGTVVQYALSAALQGQQLKSRLLTYLAVAVTLGSLVFSVLMVISTTYNKELFVPEPEHFNIAMLPKTAVAEMDSLPEGMPRAELRSADGKFSIDVWDPQHREIRADLQQPNRLSVQTFNYPGWTATVDGQPEEISTGSRFGNIEMDLTAGSHKIVLDYLETSTRRRGRLITLWTALFTLALLAVAILWRKELSNRRIGAL